MSDNKALTPDVIHAIIENQRRELTAKDKEFDLEKLKLQANQKSEERNLDAENINRINLIDEAINSYEL